MEKRNALDISSIVREATSTDGFLNRDGTALLVELINKLEPEKWGDAFIPLKKLGVHAAIEVVLVRAGRVYLTWREDKFFWGWHTPGTFLRQGESFEQAAQRCAAAELGENIRIKISEIVGPFNNTDNPRFHDLSVLVLSEITAGEPSGGKWFDSCPPDLLPVHQKYWPTIARALGQV